MNRYVYLAIITVAVTYGINHWLDNKKEELYQHAALRCAINPEGLNCGQFSTAAGTD